MTASKKSAPASKAPMSEADKASQARKFTWMPGDITITKAKDVKKAPAKKSK